MKIMTHAMTACAWAVAVVVGMATPIALSQEAKKDAPATRAGKTGWQEKRAAYAARAKRDVRSGYRYRYAMPRNLNAVDRARYAIAGILIKQAKYEEAVEELQRVIEKNADPNTRSATRLRIGHIYIQHMNDPESAIEQYQQVTGRWQSEAVRALVRASEESGDVQRAGDLLEGVAAEAKDPGQKVEVLNQLAEFYQRHDENDKAVAALRRIVESVTYEQAEQMHRRVPPGGPSGAAETRKAQIKQKVEELIRTGRSAEAERLKKREGERTDREKRTWEKRKKAEEAAKQKTLGRAKEKAQKKLEKLEKDEQTRSKRRSAKAKDGEKK